MEKKTKLRTMGSGILTLACLVLIYPLLGIGGARQTSAAILNPADIAKHNAAGDCWLIISGKVYNVTDFLSSHSGGASAITPYCGKDATAAFTGKPHPGSDLNALSAYYIGDAGVAAPLPPPPPPPSPSPVPTPAPQPLPNISPVLTKIFISPATINIKAGETKLFKASAYDQKNKPMPGSVIVFSSSNEGIGNIDTDGLFHAKAAGSVVVTASSGEIKSTATVNITENQSAAGLAVPSGPSPASELNISKQRCEELYGDHEGEDGDDVDEEDELDDFEDESDDDEYESIKNYSRNYYKM